MKKYMFTASWCPNCEVMKPIVSKIKDVEIIDVNKNKDLAEKYSIMTLPSYIVEDNEGCIFNANGIKPEKIIRKFYNG